MEPIRKIPDAVKKTEHIENKVSNQVQKDLKEVLDSQKGYLIVRRMQDLFFSVLALLVLWPLMAVLTVVVWIDSPAASPFFAQERVGKDGMRFRFYKFRSMVPNAEKMKDKLLARNEMDGPVFKIKNDPRITRVGKFIRRTSLDELPQLWNIVKGDMSIVGPRPALPREVDRYTDYERQRLYARPGLTCYWQIQPNRNQIKFAEWIELDIRYLRERSFVTDWKIIFKTVLAVFRMDGE